MIKIHIVFDVDGWAYARRARALQEFAPPDMAITVGSISERFAVDPDILLDLNYGQCIQARAGLTTRKSRALLVSSFNNGFPTRLEYLGRAKANAHAVIINNRDCWTRTGSAPGTYHLSNGVDRRVFACRTPIAERPARMISIGSDYHKALKGHPTHLAPLAERLRGTVQADWKVIDPYTANGGRGSGAGAQALTHAELADWYNGASVYVVASLTEGTPNPALEAASCGCVLVTTRVGNMPELVRHGENGILVDRTVDALEAGVREALERRQELSAAMQRDIAAWDWKERAQPFYALFRDLLSGKAPLLRPRGNA